MAIREISPNFNTEKYLADEVGAIDKTLTELKGRFGIAPGQRKTKEYKETSAKLAKRKKEIEDQLKRHKAGTEAKAPIPIRAETSIDALAAQINNRRRVIADTNLRLHQHSTGETPLNRADLKTFRRDVTKLSTIQGTETSKAYSTTSYRMRSLTKS